MQSLLNVPNTNTVFVCCRAISKRVFLEVHMTHPAGASSLQLVDSLGRNLSGVNLH